MTYLTLDVKTEGLREAAMNCAELPNLITFGIRSNMERWYNQSCKPEMLNVIETGKPDSEIPKNVGRYRYHKIQRYGIDHGLGVLTGGLYNGVISSQPKIRETRGKEVRMAIKFDAPYYLAYVHDGTSRHVGRPFAKVAVDKTMPGLLRQLSRMFDGIDLTRPYAEVSSSLVVSTG